MKVLVLPAATLALWAGAPAMAASYDDLQHCIHDDDPDRIIAACTQFISAADASSSDKLAAYYSRGLAWRAKGDEAHAGKDFAVWRKLFDDSPLNRDPNLRPDLDHPGRPPKSPLY